eukprot:m.118041 g.118041  ORF g.118041 m.118041 type:complete len:85 (+) comp37637_c1_seq3:1800-2054(+)
MGYYIHNCQKMRYKGQYHPSLLLCPEVYSWVPIESCLPRLDASKYSRLDDAKGPEGNAAVDNVLILSQQQAMPYEARMKQWFSC